MRNILGVLAYLWRTRGDDKVQACSMEHCIYGRKRYDNDCRRVLCPILEDLCAKRWRHCRPVLSASVDPPLQDSPCTRQGAMRQVAQACGYGSRFSSQTGAEVPCATVAAAVDGVTKESGAEGRVERCTCAQQEATRARRGLDNSFQERMTNCLTPR